MYKPLFFFFFFFFYFFYFFNFFYFFFLAVLFERTSESDFIRCSI